LDPHPAFDKGWMTEAVARATFGTRVFESASARMQAFYSGISEAMGGTGVLSVDGNQVARKTIPHTVPSLFTFDESLCHGMSIGQTAEVEAGLIARDFFFQPVYPQLRKCTERLGQNAPRTRAAGCSKNISR
jgi:hypothetical protein